MTSMMMATNRSQKPAYATCTVAAGAEYTGAPPYTGAAEAAVTPPVAWPQFGQNATPSATFVPHLEQNIWPPLQHRRIASGKLHWFRHPTQLGSCGSTVTRGGVDAGILRDQTVDCTVGKQSLHPFHEVGSARHRIPRARRRILNRSQDYARTIVGCIFRRRSDFAPAFTKSFVYESIRTLFRALHIARRKFGSRVLHVARYVARFDDGNVYAEGHQFEAHCVARCFYSVLRAAIRTEYRRRDFPSYRAHVDDPAAAAFAHRRKHTL